MIESRKGPMRTNVDLDWSTYYCPCGSSFCTRYESSEDWLREHISHCDNAIEEHITDDGMRCLSPNTPRDTTKKIQ